jgi:hypothetical protein
VDLVHGGTRTYVPADSTVDAFAPSAWLPDGTGLVVLATTYADDPPPRVSATNCPYWI